MFRLIIICIIYLAPTVSCANEIILPEISLPTQNTLNNTLPPLTITPTSPEIVNHISSSNSLATAPSVYEPSIPAMPEITAPQANQLTSPPISAAPQTNQLTSPATPAVTDPPINQLSSTPSKTIITPPANQLGSPPLMMATMPQTKKNTALPNAAPVISVPTSSPEISKAKEDDLSPEEKRISVATGAKMGVYFPIGEAMCRMLNRHSKEYEMRCISIPTKGSVENIDLLNKAEAEIIMMQADIQQKIWENRGEAKNLKGMRFMFSLYDEAFSVVVRKDSQIHRLEDMKANGVSVGTKGYGVYPMLSVIMSMKGWKDEQFQELVYIDFENQPEALCNGAIDAMVTVVGHPNKVIQKASEICEIRIIDLSTDNDLKTIVKNYKQYSASTIPAGMYQGVPEDIYTFGVRSTVVSSTELSDEAAYRFTKSVFSNLKDLKKLHPILGNLQLDTMITQGQIATMHPGSEKYFIEAGFMSGTHDDKNTNSTNTP